MWLCIFANGFIRFARYCGKMYSRHLFLYGGYKNSLRPYYKETRENKGTERDNQGVGWESIPLKLFLSLDGNGRLFP